MSPGISSWAGLPICRIRAGKARSHLAGFVFNTSPSKRDVDLRQCATAVLCCVCVVVVLATINQADQAQHTGSRGNRTSLFDAVLCEERTDPTGGEEKDGRSRRAALAAGTPPPSSSFSPFPFASAAMGAASAATRSHLDVGTAAERRRLEREAFRVAVHEHIRRELLKAYVEDTRAFEALGDAE